MVMTGSSVDKSTLLLEGMTKSFPGVKACDEIGFSIEPGEIHALLGENGAGKSTLVKMIYGLVRPDAGSMQLDGIPYSPPDPRNAREHGVAMVFQHFSLFDALTVAENMLLSVEQEKMKGIADRIRSVADTYGLSLDPDHVVGDLSAGEQQRVEIVRCLLQSPRLLIMDEPTSVLTQMESDKLFETLRILASEDVSVLYISHKLEEVRQLCDRATILRDGKVVATCDPASETAKSMAEMMVGSELVAPSRGGFEYGEVRLNTANICMESDSPFGTSLKNVCLEIRAGEIIGIAGVAGNGQDELLAVLSGERLPASGEIFIGNARIETSSPNTRRQLGMVAAPEQRNGHAASTDMNLVENALLTGNIRIGLSRNGVVDWQGARIFAQRIVSQFDVRTAGVEHAARSLSGGNLQKFLIGREILQDPSILVVNQPTWGVDASAASTIRQALIDLADRGTALLIISQDLDELLEISDRIAVLHDGNLSDPLPPSSTSRTEFGLLMTGMESAHAVS